MPKTGTTALQFFFSEYANRFKKAGTIYPLSGKKSNQHFYLALSPKERKSLFKEPWKQLSYELNNQKWQNVILSSERFFSKSNPTDLRDEIEKFDAEPHIILYLRNHIDAASSIYRTKIKSMNRICCDAHLFVDFLISQNTSLDYHAMLESWISVFPKENVHVISYDEMKKNSNTVKSFIGLLQQINIDVPEFTDLELTYRTHETKPDLMLDLLLRTNQFYFEGGDYWKFIRHLFELEADSSVTTKDMQFSLSDGEKLLNHYGEWGNEKKYVEELLSSDKCLLKNDDRKTLQIELLKNISPEWQDLLVRSTGYSVEQIVDIPVVSSPIELYKRLYTRDYQALESALYREAQRKQIKLRS